MTSQPFPVSDLTEAQKRELRELGYRERSPGYWGKTPIEEVRPTETRGSTLRGSDTEGPGPAVAPVPRSPYASKLEAEFAGRLEAQRLAGEIWEWQYEPITLKLAEGVRYTPDFMVRIGHSMRLIEVKGFMREAARIRLRLAAVHFPAFRFFLARKIKGEGWTVTPVEP